MDSRPPPPSGAPPPYAFVGRMYKRNLRPVVMIVTFLAAMWTLFSSSMRGHTAKATSLVTFSIILGILYMVIFAIELFGFLAASSQRLIFVRMYAWLSIVAVLILLASGVLGAVLHFTLKNDIINACSTLSEGDEVVFSSFWGPVSTTVLTADEAQQWCTRAWSHESWTQIVSLLFTLVLGGLFSAVAFSYLRQVLDPSSVANIRPPVRVGAYPSHYNPPYNGPGNYGYNGPYDGGAYQPSYAPPAGPPPGHDDGKLPAYMGGDGSVAYTKDNKDPFSDFDGSTSRPELPH
ncbi:hypothetical protein BDN72DRAFT_911745 [Pluteus cervinus]|uniref:Uncharacterized protein n=1 Tax=Pluteus cervinus TaxID=181527 RepID=A0ACD3ARI9_9AGAR|nr:hypothetical protein BDN72DRAFT_911745 [Pluteus cervinus]